MAYRSLVLAASLLAMPAAAEVVQFQGHAVEVDGASDARRVVAMRSGRRPDGSEINGRAMPWRAIGNASDEELRSIWKFLRSLPPIERDTGAGRAAPRP